MSLHEEFLLADTDRISPKLLEISDRLSKKRYLFLILANFLRFGRNYAYDNPQSLEHVLTDPNGDFRLDNFNFNLLYGVYSFPNIILPFLAGFIIDRIGSRIGCLLFAFFLIIGQFFVFMGGIFSNFPVMILGRVIFGFGGETLCVTQNTILAKWFGQKELAFALAMDIAVARIGGTLNSVLTPYFYSMTQGLFLPLFVGLILCIASFGCGFGVYYMDKNADKVEGVLNEKKEKINLKDIKDFSFCYWMLVVNCMMIYGAFMTFCGNGNDILMKLFGMTSNNAGILLMIFYLSSALTTPLFGIWADKYGKRVSSMNFVTIIFILSLTFLIYIPKSFNSNIVILPLILIGLFYAIYATMLFPCIALSVKKKTVGTAFGLNNSIENLNLSIAPLIFGLIHDNTTNKREGYFWAVMFLIVQAFLGLFTSVAVYAYDFIKNGKLEKSNNNIRMSCSAVSSF